MREPLALDTSADAEDQQLRCWRAMTPGDKLLLAVSLSRAVDQLAAAGVARRYPDASPRERFLHIATIRLGRDLALQVYPEIADLRDP